MKYGDYNFIEITQQTMLRVAEVRRLIGLFRLETSRLP